MSYKCIKTICSKQALFRTECALYLWRNQWKVMNHALFPRITTPEGSMQTVYTTRPNHFHPYFQGNPRKLYTCEYQENSRTDLSKKVNGHWPTWYFGLEGAAYNVLGSSILDGDQVASRSHRCVGNLIPLRRLLTIHLNLWWAINCHGQCSWPGVTSIDNKLWCHA